MRRVIVTRPEREAQEWVRGLREAGLDAISFPLIDIRPVTDAAPLEAAWKRIGEFQAVMFVSGNAALGFMGARRDPHAPLPRAWATGPGTRTALVESGWTGAHIVSPDAGAGQFDSENLWQLVHDDVRAGSRILIVRGSDAGSGHLGRDWLSSRLEEAGALVSTVVAYERHLPRPGVQQIEIAASAAPDAVWLFSSSQAVANLVALMPSQDFSGARAVATHPRIAQAARDAGFGVVCESRPSLAEVARSIESVA